MKTLITSFSLVLLFLSSCSEDGSKSDQTGIENNQGDTLIHPILSESTPGLNSTGAILEEISEEEEEQGVNEELAKEAIGAAVDLTKFIITNLKKNDSIRMSNREKMFAYQIGFKIKREENVFDVYKKIPDKTGVFVIRAGRKHYYLVRYEGKSKEELIEKLDEYNNSIPVDLGRASVVNLTTLCSRREKLTRDEDLSRRKEDIELPCLICDK